MAEHPFQWLTPLYLGSSLKEKEAAVRKQLNDGQFIPVRYLLVLPDRVNAHLEIVSSLHFYQKRELKTVHYMAGIAGTKSEAEALVLQIAEDALREAGTADLAAYLREKAENLWHSS